VSPLRSATALHSDPTRLIASLGRGGSAVIDRRYSPEQKKSPSLCSEGDSLFGWPKLIVDLRRTNDAVEPLLICRRIFVGHC
jgi:hypothetical protein